MEGSGVDGGGILAKDDAASGRNAVEADDGEGGAFALSGGKCSGVGIGAVATYEDLEAGAVHAEADMVGCPFVAGGGVGGYGFVDDEL